MARSAAARRSFLTRVVSIGGVGALACFGLMSTSAAQAVKTPQATVVKEVKPRAAGLLDCNGVSRVQKTVLVDNACTDIRGMVGVDNKNNWGGRFYDNGQYIGHDEPDVRFLSSAQGSGNNVLWNETLGVDPTRRPR